MQTAKVVLEDGRVVEVEEVRTPAEAITLLERAVTNLIRDFDVLRAENAALKARLAAIESARGPAAADSQ